MDNSNKFMIGLIGVVAGLIMLYNGYEFGVSPLFVGIMSFLMIK